ncbi:MAG TPA: DUF4956 domain-containing protein [Oscillospiraceae bacterium]|nr:DUF4956 domain-containing protein [Oscillospiraceae bacterium]
MLNSILSDTLTLPALLLCTASSLVLGFLTALFFRYRNETNKSFLMTLTLLPAVVQFVIMLVNGNIGTGVAVAGAFSLVRFRSLPGSAREIVAVFFAMALGLATGMGYLGIAALFFLIVGGAMLLFSASSFGEPKVCERDLKITIPENLDYEGLFDDLFVRYTQRAELIRVKTTNMGSLYELDYRVLMPGEGISKEFLDAIRCRNGNLNIVCGRVATPKDAL